MIKNNALTSRTLVDTLWSPVVFDRSLSFLRSLSLVLVGSALIGICAQISVPFYPVPITGQTFAVMLIGLTFGRSLAVATVFAYLFEGAMGLPVFADGLSGWAAFLRPSAGYLLGFVFAAAYCGAMAEKGKDRKPLKLAMTLFFAHVIIFAFGLTGLSVYFGLTSKVLAWGLYPFLPGAVIKTSLLLAVLPITWKSVRYIKGDSI